MNIFQRALQRALGIKEMMPQSEQDIYNELNRELFRYMFRGTPHIMDATMENYITKAFTYNSLIYSIISYKASIAASVGWKLIKRQGEKVIEIYDHPFLDSWYKPNKNQTLSEFIEESLLYKYTTGNSLIYAPKLETGADKGKPVKFEVIPTHITQPIFGDTNQIIKGYAINGDIYREIDAQKVLHIRYPNLDVQNTSPAIGMSPLKALVTVITQNNDAWRNLASSFQNGGPAGFFSKEGDGPNSDFTEAQGQHLIDKLKKNNSGPWNANTLASVGGNVKYNQVGLSPVDLNILEAIKLSFVQICNAFRFPAALLNMDTAMTFNVYSEAQKILWTSALKPDLDILAQKFTNDILPAYEEGLELVADYSKVDALQDDKGEMVTWLSNAWWIKGSRKQEMMGEDVDPLMDKYFIPAGLISGDEMPMDLELEDNLKRLNMPKYG